MNIISNERIGMELMGMLLGPNPDQAIRQLQELGMLRWILPELDQLIGLDHGPHHQEGDPFQHTLLVLKNLPPDPSPSLALAALFHDLGKAKTAEMIDGKQTFHGHEDVSTELAGDIFRRLHLGFSKPGQAPADLNRVQFLVQNHMRIRMIPGMRQGKQKELFRHPGFPELLQLLRADDLGKIPFEDTFTQVEALFHSFQAVPDVSPKSRGINGHRVMEVLGLAPGPLVREILDMFDEALAENSSLTEDELFAQARFVFAHDLFTTKTK